MTERSGNGWSGYLEGAAPLQGCGRVDGLPWYFRARGNTWSFEVANDPQVNPEHLPIVGFEGVSGWEIEVDWPEASYMEQVVGWQIVEECIGKFRRQELPAVSCREKGS